MGFNSGGGRLSPSVPNPAALPPLGSPGRMIPVEDDGDGNPALYGWKAMAQAWIKMSDPDSSGLVRPVPVADGGHGATNPGAARAALGLTIGTHVQAYSAKLDSLAALAWADGKFVKITGPNSSTLLNLGLFGETLLAAVDGPGARTSLGLGERDAANGFAGLDGVGRVGAAQAPSKAVYATGGGQALTPADIGAEAQSNKGANNGYAGLDVNGFVAQRAKLVKGVASGTAQGAIGVNGPDLSFGDGAVQHTVERQSNKGFANGYAALDANSRLMQAATAVQPVAPPNNTGAIGVDAGDLKFGDGAQVRVAERVDRKGAANGYPSLDVNSLVIEAVQKVRAGLDPAAQAGAISVNGGDLKFHDGANLRVAQKTSEKGQPNGYAGLDGAGALLAPATSVKNGAATTTAGSIGVNAGKLEFGDGAQVRQAEHGGNRNQPNGYCGLDVSGKVAGAQLNGQLLSGAQAHRKIGNGTTNVPANTTVDLGTFTRNANEQLYASLWIQQNDANLSFAPGGTSPNADGVIIFFERTVNAGEFKARARNANLSTARDIEWAVFGLVP